LADFKIDRSKKGVGITLRGQATIYMCDNHEQRIWLLDYENRKMLDEVNAKLFVNKHRLARSLRKGDGTTGTVLNIDSLGVYKEISKVLEDTLELEEKWQASARDRRYREEQEEERELDG